jgi:hypothetical protein
VKKPIRPKDGTIFEFMIYPPNDDSEVIDGPLLAISEPEVKRCLTEENENNDISSETTQAEFEFVESLLGENGIEGYSLSYPSEDFPNKFPLTRNSPSHCPLCDREHTSDNTYIIRNKKSYRFKCYHANHERNPGTINPSIKLTISETALDREKKLPIPEKQGQPKISDPNDYFVWWDLISMCTSKKRFTRNEVYNAI